MTETRVASPDLDLLSLTAKDLMTEEVVTIPRDMGMQAAARRLAQKHISGAPVVDEHGRCVGVLSSSDFVSCCAANRSHCGMLRGEFDHVAYSFSDCVSSEWQMVITAEKAAGLVRENMTPDPVTATPETTLARMARMMVDARVHRLIVVDEDHRPLGIISTTDIVAAVARVCGDE